MAPELQPYTMPELRNLFDYATAAADLLPPAYHAYYAGGVADNLTRDDNRTAFNRLKLLPRVLRNVSQRTINASLRYPNTALPFPLLLAPTAMAKLAHPDGEVGLGNAALTAGIPQLLSTMSTCAVEEVTAIGHDVWFQLYLFKDREASKSLVQRVEAAGCKALVLTVDVPILGIRNSLARSHEQDQPALPLPNLMRTNANGELAPIVTLEDRVDPSVSWDDVAWLQSITNLPIWLKGILRPDDALRAVEAGVDGIIVSNHGGRQLDTAIATIDALPNIAKAVDGAVPLLMDGGIRRGTDMIKALALGASAVLIGRPVLWGLAVNGTDGAAHVLEILRTEFDNAMAQCGCRTVDEITEDLIFNADCRMPNVD